MNSRKEMLDALLEGKELVDKEGCVVFYNIEHPEGPFVLRETEGEEFRVEGYWDEWLRLKIKEEPKKRFMTRDEILNFVAEHPNCLVDICGKWASAQQYDFSASIEKYSYCLVVDGKRTKPMKFEVED